jgi:hypothetical protein
MSLGGLLSIGRAFGKVRSRPAVFRTAEGSLPDFRTDRSPARSAPVAAPAAPGPLAELEGAAPRDFAATASWFGDERKGRAERSKPVVADDASRAGGSPQVEAPEAGLPASPRARRRSRPGVPVQCELALAAVRVVRNDLYADDLELVPRPAVATRGLTLGAERTGRTAANGGWRGWLAHWAGLVGLRCR